ncbi:hypothetical protein Tco_0679183 [Tanacetum coccineum]|uniref:Reverse transcriptase domain-containing protein n=1 Tax=Tanacetum coccineum TaxID=301880 RepID=A0ABQ4XHD5_9ASTR
METKDTLSSCSNSEEQQMQQIQDKAKKSCMVSFRQLHSHMKLLLNNNLNGIRTESGFKRAFATLFGQDVETFIDTMFLNMDQLENQLDKEEFQEIGSMASFKVLETQFQMFIKSRMYMDDEYVKSIDERAKHKQEYNSWVNERQMQNHDSKQSDSRIQAAVYRECMPQCSISPETDLIKSVETTGKIFKTVGLKWIPTGKIFTSSTTKVDSEPTNGSNDDITNQYKCKQTLDVNVGTLNVHAGTSLNPTKEGLRVCSELEIHDHNNEHSSSKLVLKVVPPADKIATSRQELELLFHHHITMPRSTCQLAKALQERPQGALPSNTIPYQREQINSITTRSGLTTVEPSILPPVTPTTREEVQKEPETLMDEVHVTSPTSTTCVPPPGIHPVSPPKPKEESKPNPHQLKIPYPSRLDKTKLLDKNDVQVSEILKILKQLHFDISLMDALTQIPKYSKVLKDLLKDKEKLEELANTPINAECSAILLIMVPGKLEDPGKFLIPCVLQDLEVCNSLSDSGASINLMPFSINEKLGIEPLKPTQMTLELANRFVTYPKSIAEDVDHRVPIILGTLFLRTTKALVGLYKEKLTLRIGNEELVSRAEIFSRNSPSRKRHSVHSINIIDSPCEEISNQNKKNSGSTTSHLIFLFLVMNNFALISINKKRRVVAVPLLNPIILFLIIKHFDLIIKKKSGSTTSHSNPFLFKYESFYFDLSIDTSPPIIERVDLGELTGLLKENISSKIKDDKELKSKTSTKKLTIHELNDLRLLLSNCDSTISEKFSEIDPLLSFPFGNKNKIFDLGILNGVYSNRSHILPLNDFSPISFVSDLLFLSNTSEIETFLSFLFGLFRSL